MPLTSGYFLLWHWHHQMFYPFVTISAAPARESDDLRHAMSAFSLFLSSFFGCAHPPKRCKRRSIWRNRRTGTAFTRHTDRIYLQMLLWRTLNWDTEMVEMPPSFWRQPVFSPFKQMMSAVDTRQETRFHISYQPGSCALILYLCI